VKARDGELTLATSQMSAGLGSACLFFRTTTYYQAGGMVQVVECLPSTGKSLTSIPSTTKEKTYYFYI
jgi:hypothetical protein